MDLFSPEFYSGPGKPEQRTVVAVPEASVDKKDGMIFWKDKIGTSRHPVIMEMISEPFRMESGTDQFFGFRVSASDPGHHPASGERIHNVCHPIFRFQEKRGMSFKESFSR
jgi:hypothetical protein